MWWHLNIFSNCDDAKNVFRPVHVNLDEEYFSHRREILKDNLTDLAETDHPVHETTSPDYKSFSPTHAASWISDYLSIKNRTIRRVSVTGPSITTGSNTPNVEHVKRACSWTRARRWLGLARTRSCEASVAYDGKPGEGWDSSRIPREMLRTRFRKSKIH